MDVTYREIAKMIDHSLHNPVLADADLEWGCHLALDCDVACVCVPPYYVARCAEILAGSAVAAGTTVGFPHGGQPSALKVAEARQALADGAQELDMVVNISKVLSGDWAHVREDIRGVLEAAHEAGAKIKVTFENCYLEDYHKIALCEVCVELGADWVRTSTGYGRGGATQHDLELMRRHCPPPVQIKAAGGVRTLDALLGVRQLGVSRVGASRTASILDEYRRHANV